MKLLLLSLLLLVTTAARAQYDVNASLYGQFSGTTSGNGISQSPENSAGVMVGLRKYVHPWRGYELTYSFNHANQDFAGPLPTLSSIAANAHSVTADYVVSLPVPLAGLRLFALGGGGLVVFAPQSTTGASTDLKGVFSYGAGTDIRLVPRIGLRLQYRGLLYRAPDFGNAFTSTTSFTRTSEPMAGIYLKF